MRLDVSGIGTMRRHAVTVVGVLVAALVISACTGSVGSVDGPVLEGDRRTGGPDGVVHGVLIVEPECLYLLKLESGVRFPVIWPHGTSWDAEQSAVVLPGGDLVHDGDSVSGSGGYHSKNLDWFIVPEGVEMALACVDNQHGNVAVFNTRGDIDVQR